MRSRISFLLLGAVLVAAGCGGDTTSNAFGQSGLNGSSMTDQQRQTQVNDATKAITEGAGAKVTEGENHYGFQLIQKISKANGPKNICISPLSVTSVLEMLYNGAIGETKQSMSKALGLQKLSVEDINTANKNLLAIVNNVDPAKVKFNVANSVWVQQGVPVSPDFIQRQQEFYGAKVSTLDLHKPGAETSINDWVSQKTGGRIPSIVDKVPSDARLYVVNAVYFKGLWKQPFKPENTKDAPFTMSDGSKKSVPMMNGEVNAGYVKGDDATAISLPYGDGRFEMLVIVPNGKNDAASLMRNLNLATWAKWTSAMAVKPVQLTLPKFKSDTAINLNESLKDLGLGIAFDPQKADFSAILSKSDTKAAAEKLYLSRVDHKTYIDVAEDGTEAAAATSGVVSATAVLMPFKVVVDKPFLYAIRDSQTGSVLFVGALYDPTASASDDKVAAKKAAAKQTAVGKTP